MDFFSFSREPLITHRNFLCKTLNKTHVKIIFMCSSWWQLRQLSFMCLNRLFTLLLIFPSVVKNFFYVNESKHAIAIMSFNESELAPWKFNFKFFFKVTKVNLKIIETTPKWVCLLSLIESIFFLRDTFNNFSSSTKSRLK